MRWNDKLTKPVKPEELSQAFFELKQLAASLPTTQEAFSSLTERMGLRLTRLNRHDRYIVRGNSLSLTDPKTNQKIEFRQVTLAGNFRLKIEDARAYLCWSYGQVEWFSSLTDGLSLQPYFVQPIGRQNGQE